MKINPLNPLYMKGFNDGVRTKQQQKFNEGVDAANERFIEGFEKLKQTPGIGPKTVQKIIEVMNLPVEEKKVDK